MTIRKLGGAQEEDEDAALHQIAMCPAGRFGEDAPKVVEIQERNQEHVM